jgi:RimJ/RimL family protein N-acetyltransferase
MMIETSRLTIRSFLESDIPEYAAIVAGPQVTRFLGDGSPHSYEQAAEADAAVLDYGVNTLKLCDIVAVSALENMGSVRVMEKIGLQCEAFGQVRGRKTVRYRQPDSKSD